jgi:hypothetical protein
MVYSGHSVISSKSGRQILRILHCEMTAFTC